MSRKLYERKTHVRIRIEATFSNGHERTVFSEWKEDWISGDVVKRFTDEKQESMTREGRDLNVTITRMAIYIDTRETETWKHTFDKTEMREERTPANG